MSKFPTLRAILIALAIGLAWGTITGYRKRIAALEQERAALQSQIRQSSNTEGR